MNGCIYYIAYVEGVDESKNFYFKTDDVFKRTYYVDVEKLKLNGKRTSFSESIYYVNSQEQDIYKNIVLCSFYDNKLIDDIGLLTKYKVDNNIPDEYVISYNNNRYPIDNIKNDVIYFNENGISIVNITTNKLYYVAYVDGVDESPNYILKSHDAHREFVYIDITKLKENKRVAFKDAIVYEKDSMSVFYMPSNYILLCAFYGGMIIPCGVLGSVILDYYNRRNYKNDILFRPEFYSYAYGRQNNENGVGIGWYKRFNISLATDVHLRQQSFLEHIIISNDCQVDVILNCGDYTNGDTTTNGSSNMALLNLLFENYDYHNRLPMILSKGNHDVPNATQE